ncbi:MAG: hypothetical protein H7296_08045 [Bacteroidia bacterium]|nr:hypothetical protein [Bacteroidia bacterium]
MHPQKRNIIQGVIAGSLIIVSSNLLYKGIHDNNSQDIISAITLIVSTFAFYVSLLSLNQTLDSKLPQIVVEGDFKSRYSLILLSIKNYGQMTAYDIEIKMNNPILNHKNENILTQTIFDNVLKIPVLQQEQDVKFTIDEVSSFYGKYKDSEIKYMIEVSYKLSNESSKRICSNTFIDLSFYRNTLLFENESLKANYDIQKIPTILESINKSIASHGK